MDEKIKALAQFLELEDDEIDEIEEMDYDHYGLTLFEYGSEKYAIGDDDEADDAAKEYIEGSLWAFNASFIINHSKLPYEAEEMIQSYQEKECENANETIEAMIEDIDDFVDDAVSSDGRGHFLSGYDGAENEEEIDGTYYFIYRVN